MNKSKRTKTPAVLQSSRTDCGAACLAMILGTYGKNVPLRELHERLGIQRDGTSASAIIEVAKSYGLRAEGLSLGSSALQKLDTPAILPWGSHHFVVLTKWRRNRTEIIDPRFGRMCVDELILNEEFRNVALVFEPETGFSPRAKPKRLWRRYLAPLRKNWKLVSKAISISLFLRALALALPILTAVVVDRIIPHHNLNALSIVTFGLAALVLFSGLSNVMRSYLLVGIRAGFDEHMMLNFFEHLIHLPFPFFETRSTGDLLVRIASNTAVRDTLSQQSLMLFSDVVFAMTYLILMLLFSIPLTLIVLVLMMISVLIAYWTIKALRPLIAREIQAQTKSQSYLIEMVRGVETVKTAATENRVFDRWRTLFLAQLKASISRDRRSSLISGVASAANMAGPLILLIAGTTLVLNQQLTLGEMLGFNALAASFLAPLNSLVSNIQSFQLVGVHLDRLDDIFEAPREAQLQSSCMKLKLRGCVSVENVSFQYGPRSPNVIHSVSLNVSPGMMVAVVGATGSGKSTLAKLLTGLYKPTSGKIYFDGVDIDHLDLYAVRSQLGVVPQGAFLFDDTIRNNIAFHDPGLSLGNIKRAAQLAEISQDIEGMPMGYDTLISETGRNLSGGQRQRLCIARGLVHDPRILLFDEATNELDSETEMRIYSNLASYGCTQIVIAHRLSAAQHADLIVVIDHGTILEKGSHQALLAMKGRYAQMYAAYCRPSQNLDRHIVNR